MRTKSEIFKLAVLQVTLLLAFVLAPQVFAQSKAEVGYCEASFSVHLLKISSKPDADELGTFNLCFAASGQVNIGDPYELKSASISSRWSGNAIRDLRIKFDDDGSSSFYTLGKVEASDFGKTVTASDDRGGYVELRIARNTDNNIRIKCIDCRMIDIVKALNTLEHIQFIDANALPKEKKATFNFNAIPVRLVASMLALDADVDMAQYVRIESQDLGRRKEGDGALPRATFTSTYVERYIFLEKSLKE